jgi:AcrR family transcriptional regulator
MATAHQRFTAEDRKQQILEIATELFANQGFNGTTTREIANRAKVNEAIIFRHFPTKEELYWSVIEAKCGTGGGRARIRERLAQGGNLREVFADIAEGILRRRQNDQTLTRLLFFSALEKHTLSERFFKTYIAEYYETLAEFIRERMESGDLRTADPTLAARGFFGMVIYHSLVQELFGAKRYKQYDLREVSETIVTMWLDGMLPTAAGREVSQSVPEFIHQRGKS